MEFSDWGGGRRQLNPEEVYSTRIFWVLSDYYLSEYLSYAPSLSEPYDLSSLQSRPGLRPGLEDTG
jgi:hypothetical protein